MDSATHVGVKMPAALSRQIRAIAESENNTLSAVVRRLLTAAVQREGDIASRLRAEK